MYRRYPALLSTIALMCALDFLQSGMIAFASVPIRGEIDASPEEYSLIAALYACVAVVVIAKQRWLTERLGWRNYILGSITIFIAGAALCGSSHSYYSFAAGRIVMALGGAAFMTTSRILVNQIPPGPGRFVGIKVFAVGLALGMASAPLLASLAVSEDSWQSIFSILVAVALAVAALAIRCVPREAPPAEALSRTSAGRLLLLACSSFFLLYMLQRSYYQFYDDALITLISVTLGVIALYTYFHVEHRHEQPLLRVRELLTPRYTLGVALFSFSYLLLGANNYVLPLYLQSGLGYTWETVGQTQSLGLIGALLTWLVMAKVLPKSPVPKKFLVLGFLALAGAAWILSSLSPVVQISLHVLPALALNGSFVMLVLATTAMQTFRDFGSEEALFTHAQQVKNMIAQVATASGTALATIFLQWRSTVHYGSIHVRMTPGDAVYAEQLQHLTDYFSATHEAGSAGKMALAQLAQSVSQQSSLLAGIDYFWIVTWIALAAMLTSLVQKVFK